MKKIIYMSLILLSFQAFANKTNPEVLLQSVLKKSEYGSSLTFVTCSKKHNECATLHASLDNYEINPEIKEMDYIKDDNMYIQINGLYYFVRELGEEYKIDLSYDFFVYDKLEKFREMQIRRGNSVYFNQAFMLREDYKDIYETDTYYGLMYFKKADEK